MKNTKTTIVVFITLLLILLPIVLPSTLAATFDLGRVNYPDPTIGINYNEPVLLLSGPTFLSYQTLVSESDILISIDPVADSAYARSYNISTTNPLGLAKGGYSLTVSAQNALGLTATDSVTFNITGLNITIVDASGELASGFADHTPFDIIFQSYVFAPGSSEYIPFNAECKYRIGEFTANEFFSQSALPLDTSRPSSDAAQYQNPSGTLGTRHVLSDLETPLSTLTVFCRNFQREGREIAPVARVFDIGYLLTPPQIVVTATPAKVIDANNPYTSIYVETDQESYCHIRDVKNKAKQSDFAAGAKKTGFASYTVLHNQLIYYNSNEGINTDLHGDLQKKDFSYEITCTNLAGLFTAKTVDIEVDLENGIIITPLKPSSNIHDSSEFSVATNLPAVCSINITSPLSSSSNITLSSQDSLAHNHVLTGLISGNRYSYNIFCDGTGVAQGKNASKVISFTYEAACPQGMIFENGVCVDALSQCTKTCALDGVCSAECALDSACLPDPDCSNSASQETICPYSCEQDDMCQEGCGEHKACMPDVDCEEGFPWLAFIFLFVGLLCMSGAGYYLYMENTAKKERKLQAERLAAQGASTAPNSAKTKVMSEQERKLRELQERQERAMRIHEENERKRDAQRDSVFSIFDKDGKKHSSLPVAKVPAQESQTPAAQEEQRILQPDAKEEKLSTFEKLDKLIKRSKKP